MSKLLPVLLSLGFIAMSALKVQYETQLEKIDEAATQVILSFVFGGMVIAIHCD
jgi:hypothetical protein